MSNLPRIAPMVVRRHEPFVDPDWLFELKHDGFRAIAYVEDGSCRLVSRRRNVYKSFEGVKSSLGAMPADRAILDGEIVCLDETGKSIFKDVLYRRVEPVLYAFDLLWLDDEDLRGMPLIQRKSRLRRLLGSNRLERVLYADHVEAHGVDFFREVCRRDFEGIVAKRRDGVYGIRSTWVKIKNPNYSQVKGRRELFDAIRRQASAHAEKP